MTTSLGMCRNPWVRNMYVMFKGGGAAALESGEPMPRLVDISWPRSVGEVATGLSNRNELVQMAIHVGTCG